MSDIASVVLSGILLKPLIYAPAAIPLRLEGQYFALETSHPATQAMLDADNRTFYTPETLGEIQLEPFTVLRD